MQTPIRTEGIILRHLNFKEYDQIFSAFTLEHGLVDMIIQGANRSKNKAPIAPLLHAEFMLVPTKGSLFKCRELSVINHQLSLRQNLYALEVACDFLKAIRESQFGSKPSPDIYKLLIYYLGKLSNVKDPFVLAASFRLKILQHDGLLGISQNCCLCSHPLHDQYIYTGESYCQKDAPLGSLFFSNADIILMQNLIHCKFFSELATQEIEANFLIKIKSLFNLLLVNN